MTSPSHAQRMAGERFEDLVSRFLLPSKTAKDIFTVGQAVRSSLLAQEYGLFSKLTFGEVVGFTRKDSMLVKVRILGQSARDSYHVSFWEKVETAR